MTTTATTKRAARSGNPATKAAAAKETAAEKKRRIEAEAAERAAQEERIRKAQEAFKALELPAPEFDADGYEIIPDKSKLEGQSYKFAVGGKRYTIPNLQYLPASLGMRLGQMTEDGVHTAVFGRYAPDLLDHCSADQLQHILKRWQEYSQGVGLGE